MEDCICHHYKLEKGKRLGGGGDIKHETQKQQKQEEKSLSNEKSFSLDRNFVLFTDHS